MTIEFYQIDAFTDRPFRGNPAGVCFLDAWPDDELLRSIAAENNLAETAFVLPTDRGFKLRWFTPEIEIDLCGHATLATAHALFAERRYPGERITFQTQSGELVVERRGERLEMDFPSRPGTPCDPPDGLRTILGAEAVETLRARDLLVVLDSAEAVRRLSPDIAALADLPEFGVIVTARGDDCDFVSRFFAPRAGIAEDPVTGSAHCTLIPYWAGLLGKETLHARQLSARGGELFCTNRGDRVTIGGRAVTVISGTITL